VKGTTEKSPLIKVNQISRIIGGRSKKKRKAKITTGKKSSPCGGESVLTFRSQRYWSRTLWGYDGKHEGKRSELLLE